jgi:hypothetical protein
MKEERTFYYYRLPLGDWLSGLQRVDKWCGDIQSAIQKSVDFINDKNDLYRDDNKYTKLEQISFVTASLSIAFSWMKFSKEWNGVVDSGPYIFFLPDVENASTRFGFIWEQGDNTFVATPFPYTWLGECEVKFTAGSLEAPEFANA